ncbi:hypothetical protein B0H17DRAFT_1090070 [Mycena rosella]|uniref:Transmembrane protein 53 n=1 Tax=Mycena rosella TaxID=1033263 RepID=A0AAD7CVS4_MYCRO|nr:hypothetical protein B0H17DRAFT_1090070 [Mycena rosella]
MPSTGSFVPLGNYAYIQRATTVASETSTDPTVIVIFGWMSAKLGHLHKYTEVYQEMYPQATLILVRSELSFFLTSTSALETHFKPVIEALEALGCLEDGQRILTHTFSNGGSFHLLAFARMLASKAVDMQTPRPPSAMVIDSSPGGADLASAQRALTVSVRNSLLRLLAKGFVRLAYCFLWAIGQISRRPNPVHAMAAGLRRPCVLPWIDGRSPRLYVYSKADDMVPWADIEENIARSTSDGLDVRRLRFEDSAHVAHARVHPEEYWAAVRTLWADACLVHN